MSLLEGKRALIMGVANDHSIAWSIAETFHREGARLAFSYPNESIEKRLRKLVEPLSADAVLPCDVADDAAIESLFEEIGERWGGLDIVVHAIAFAQRDELKGRFLETSREGFRLALDISAYSLVAIARAAERWLEPSAGNLLTLSYFGAEKVIPHYNAMGIAKAALEACVRYLAWDLGEKKIRINAISAGPLRTLSSAGITGFRSMLHHHEDRAPLRRNVSGDDVARAALSLCSDLGSGITGEVVHVDAGYNIVGM